MLEPRRRFGAEVFKVEVFEAGLIFEPRRRFGDGMSESEALGA